MAIKELKSIKFPGLEDTYIIPENNIELDDTLSIESMAADAKAVGDAIAEKSDTLRNVSGSVITINDSAKVPIQGLRLFGKTTQNTTTGKNLLPNTASSSTLNGITFAVNEDGSVMMNGTATSDASFPIFGSGWDDTNKKLLLDGTASYILSKGTANAVVYVRDAISNRNYETPLNGYKTIEKVDCLTYAYIRVLSGKTLNNETIYPMLRLSSATDDTYEPYTGGIPSPNPDYPQELVSAGDEGSLGVTVAGKNLLKNMLVNGSQSGVTWEVGTEGSVTISGTATGSNVFINILKNQKENTVIKMFAGKVIPNTASRTQTTLDGKKATLSEDLNIDGINGNVYYKISAGMTVNKTYYPQIEFGTTATAYEPYRENQILTISTPNGLPGIPVTSGGNYTDETGQQWVCDEVDFGRGVYVKRIFGTVFKSGVGWNLAGTKNGLKRFYTNQFMGVIKNAKDDATKECALCSHFINVTASDTWNEVTGISVNSKGRLDIYYSGIEQTTAALDVYFSSNPVAFMAELATPIETSLSAEELAAYAALHTNYPNTTILNDGGAGMEVKYCTPSTSVPMVHSEGDKGKILTIDEHGCVAKAIPEEFSAIDIDFDISNEGEANPINADTLGGISASNYALNNYVKECIRKAAPRNLLDNSDFTNPVNQRGQDSYSLGSWGGYHIDRWYTGQDGADITFHTDGIHLTKTIVQPIENPSRLADKVITLVVKINGEVCCGSGTVKYINGWSRVLFVARDSFNFGVETTNDNGLTVNVHCKQQGVVEWAALYEGEYTAETLPEYQPKGYGAELAECQRYYQRFHFLQYETLGLAYEGPGYTFIQLSGEDMRIKYPSMTISAPIQIGSRTYTPSGCNINNGTIIIGQNYEQITTYADGCYAYCPTVGGCVIEMNADL